MRGSLGTITSERDEFGVFLTVVADHLFGISAVDVAGYAAT